MKKLKFLQRMCFKTLISSSNRTLLAKVGNRESKYHFTVRHIVAEYSKYRSINQRCCRKCFGHFGIIISLPFQTPFLTRNSNHTTAQSINTNMWTRFLQVLQEKFRNKVSSLFHLLNKGHTRIATKYDIENRMRSSERHR